MPRYSSSAIYEELSQEKIKETKISCHNIGDIAFVKKFFPQKHCIADVGLNIFNQYAADFLKELGVTHMVVSPELTKQEMLQLVDHAEGDFEVIGKDKITDMVTVYCPASSVMPCDKQCENCPWNRTFLKDAEGEFYEVVRKRNYSKIYHSSHLDITDCLEELQGHNIRYVRVSEENFNTKKMIGHFRKGIL